MLDMETMKGIFGEKNDICIPSGPALVYMYRRFGFTDRGSDGDKQVCCYVIPTEMEGVAVRFSFGGTHCFLGVGMRKDVEALYHEDDRRPAREWWERCEAWAEAQGMPKLIDIFHADENEELFISQAKAWLQEQGLDLDALTQEQWDREWGGRYCGFVDKHNARIADAYREVEPQPKYPWPDGDGEFVTAVKTAVANTLRDMLKPVTVRDLFINILGEVNPGEWDEENGWGINVVDHCRYAGFGVPTGAYNDPNLFIDMMDGIKELGQGDMVAGMKLVMSWLATVTAVKEEK